MDNLVPMLFVILIHVMACPLPGTKHLAKKNADLVSVDI